MNQTVIVKRMKTALKEQGLSDSTIQAAVDATFVTHKTMAPLSKTLINKAMRKIIKRLTNVNEPVVVMRTKKNKIRVYSQTGFKSLQAHGIKLANLRHGNGVKVTKEPWIAADVAHLKATYNTSDVKSLASYFGRTPQAIRSKAVYLGITNKRK